MGWHGSRQFWLKNGVNKDLLKVSKAHLFSYKYRCSSNLPKIRIYKVSNTSHTLVILLILKQVYILMRVFNIQSELIQFSDLHFESVLSLYWNYPNPSLEVVREPFPKLLSVRGRQIALPKSNCVRGRSIALAQIEQGVRRFSVPI